MTTTLASTYDDVADLAAVIAEHAAPRPKIDRVRWVAENICIPAENSPHPGPFDLERHPYAAEPIAAMDDPNVREIVLCWATQAGKGDTTWAMLGSQAYIDPKPVLYAGPDQDYVTEQRDRFLRIVEESPKLAPLAPAKHEINLRTFRLGGMRLYWAWSGSVQKLSGRSTPMIIASEASHWQRLANDAAGIQLIRNRLKSWADMGFLIVVEGTPTDELCPMWERYEAGDRRKFYVPCPHCGKFQTLRHWVLQKGDLAGKGGLGGWRDEHGAPKEVEQARAEAYYICLKGCRIEERDRREMISRGVWVPEGVQIDREGRLHGEPEQQRTRSYHLNSLYASALSFGDNAAELVASRDDPEAKRDFDNNWRAERWLPSRRLRKPEIFARDHALDGHRRGIVPAEAVFVTLGADVQASQVFWAVRAWGDQATSWLVDFGIVGEYVAGLDEEDEAVEQRIEENLLELEEVLDRDWPVADGGDRISGAAEKTIRLGLVDSGYHHKAVAGFVRAQPNLGQRTERVRMIRGLAERKGSSSSWYARPYDRKATDGKALGGKEAKGGRGVLKVWMVDVGVFKDDLQSDRWPTAAGAPGSWNLPEDLLPSGWEYCRQVVNEARVVEPDKKTGRKVARWKVVDGRTGNHFWDTEVYNRVAGEMVTGGDWRLDARIRRALGRLDGGRTAGGVSEEFTAR